MAEVAAMTAVESVQGTKDTGEGWARGSGTRLFSVVCSWRERGQVSLLIRRSMELGGRESESKKLTCFFIAAHRPQGTFLIVESETLEVRARCQ